MVKYFLSRRRSSGVTASNENATYTFDPTDLTDWTTTAGTFVTVGSTAVFSASSPPTNADTVATPTLETAGDFIFYLTVSADVVVGSSMHWQIGAAGDGKIIISLGYNWETSSLQINRVSLGVRRLGSIYGVQGPSVDYSSPVEIAAQYDSRVGCCNLFVRESGRWKFYGSETLDAPFTNVIRIYTGGADAAAGTTHAMSVCRPNYVAIGDSICAGHNFYDPVPSYYAGDDDGDNAWQQWCVPTDGLTNNLIVNYGVGGENSSEIDARVSSMMTKTEPAVVFLHASTNDYGAAVSLSTRSTNIQSSVDTIVAAGAECVLLNATAPNSNHVSHPDNADYYIEWWDDYSGGITDCSAKVDIMANIEDANGYADPTYFESDGIHPNATGYQQIGEDIAARISP